MPTLLQLSNAGGRLVIASDGVWDALHFQEALNYTRGLPAEAAANRIVKVLLYIFIPGVSLVDKA
jgi:serine/threonine protein phosphatase PrpC